jgi:hypothetical protein
VGELVFAASLDADRRARAAAARAADATVPPRPLDPVEAYAARDAIRGLLRDDAERAAFQDAIEKIRAEAAAELAPWHGKVGWELEPELEIKEEKKTVRHGDDKHEVEVPVEPAYVVYNALVSRHNFRPFRTLSGEPRVAIPTAHGVEVHDPRTPTFVDWVGFRYYALNGDRIPDRHLLRAAKVLTGRATAPELPNARVVDLAIRVAAVGNRETLLDLCDPERRCVRISADGWTVEAVGMPIFERPAHMLPLPAPARAAGGDGDWTRANGLFSFVSVGLPDPEESGDPKEKAARTLRLDGQRLLVLAEVVHSILAPRSPKVIPVLNGDDGSGKSHAAAKLGAVTDPSIVQHVPIPETEQDLLALALNRATISLDNVSHIDLWLSDALARLCTGTGLAKRRLYTDRDEVVSRLIPRIILNGITAVPRNPDLIRRVLFLWATKPDQTLGDEEYEAAWNEAHPRILGGFLDLAVLTAKTLRDAPPTGNGDSMADFVRIGRAVAIATGGKPNDFDTAWAENQSRQLAAAEENPWVGALRGVFEGLKPGETITPEDIARKISTDRHESFPRGVTSQEVGNAISRVRRTLRTVGIAVERRRGSGGARLYFRGNSETGVTGVTQTHLPSEKGSDTHSDTRVTPPTLGVTTAVTPPGGAPLECHRSKSGPLTSEGGMEVTPVTPVTPPSTISHVEQVGADVSPDPEDVFRGRPSRADRARASGRWSDPPSDGDSSPPTEPSSIDPPSVAPPLLGAVPPDPSRLEAATTDPAATQTADPPRPDSARLEAATRELTDLLRSVGTADRNVIHSILGASGYSGSEISAAVGSVCGAGLVRQDPGGVLRWKEVSA